VKFAAWALLIAAIASLSSARARAETPPSISPDLGVVVVSPSKETEEDLRLGRIASRFANRGIESFAAADLVRPPPDPEGCLLHGRWRLDDARRARRLKRYPAAAAAGDEAIRVIERCAFAREHLDLLVEALIERGATALSVNDAATAETVFLKAIAFEPLFELDQELYDKHTQDVFGEVRRASRELRYGSVRVEVTRMPGAAVAIDFGTPQDPPISSNLPDGRHFLSISAPARHEVVAVVPVRAERETSVYIRPPPSGDVGERASVLASFRGNDAHALTEIARVSGLRFVLTASIGASGIQLQMHDGRTGAAISGASGTLSVDPSPDEIDAAVVHLVDAATLVEPRMRGESASQSWYTTWWGITLIGVAAVGAAAGTFFVIQSNAKTQYQFAP
jgi:hypothetical protein